MILEVNVTDEKMNKVNKEPGHKHKENVGLMDALSHNVGLIMVLQCHTVMQRLKSLISCLILMHMLFLFEISFC